MSVRKNGGRVRLSAALAALAAGLSGCTGAGALGEDPETMLTMALDALVTSGSVPFAAKTEFIEEQAGVTLTGPERYGEMDAGQGVVLLSDGNRDPRVIVRQAEGWRTGDREAAVWPAGAAFGSNPLACIERLKQAGSEVETDSGAASDTGPLVLRVSADFDKIANIWQARLSLPEEQWRTAAESLRQSARLSDSDAERLIRSLEETRRTYGPSLDERLAALRAEAEYRVWIGPGRKIEQIVETTRLQYDWRGARHSETVVETYRFPAADSQDRIISPD
ncbi:hypothetical protein ACFQWB_01990 [Paenibacillus thermoaerophilus]|uniref:Lipoprotein n=1 Tax=Paenibacillus thermoaerophilus TaxID=1215385 RepID=A0ABW2UXU9_9BACL|nr:hypothetical protein [Paenibacillus thermoaerophilus]TMV19118.1 hypothetical protein FE781_01000 [Paenibacillus thermoaerophilus]